MVQVDRSLEQDRVDEASPVCALVESELEVAKVAAVSVVAAEMAV